MVVSSRPIKLPGRVKLGMAAGAVIGTQAALAQLGGTLVQMSNLMGQIQALGSSQGRPA